MIKVILDANFLFIPFQLKIDIFAELGTILGRFEPIVLSTTFEELRNLSAKKPKIRTQAFSALDLIKKCTVINVEKKPGENSDDVILRLAKELKCPVATNDRILRKKLREEGIATIFLRQKSHLKIEGYVPS
ncbi:MAG: DNA-binding protein [Candidatus Bathyarchaeia archaeon]